MTFRKSPALKPMVALPAGMICPRRRSNVWHFAACLLLLVLLSVADDSERRQVLAHAPHSGLDFSIGVDVDEDGSYDCDSSSGPSDCYIEVNQGFLVSLRLKSLPTGVHEYTQYTMRLSFAGPESSSSADTSPECFPFWVFKPGLIAGGCVTNVPGGALPPSSHMGVLADFAFQCTESGTLTLMHGTTLGKEADAYTNVVYFDVLNPHAEGEGTSEEISVHCGGAPPPPAVLLIHGWGGSCSGTFGVGGPSGLGPWLQSQLPGGSTVSCFDPVDSRSDGYDHRLGMEVNGRALNQTLGTLQQQANTKVHLVAHSFGGLVARYCIEQVEACDEKVASLTMLGTPNQGWSGAYTVPLLCRKLPQPISLKWKALCAGSALVGEIAYSFIDQSFKDMIPIFTGGLNGGFICCAVPYETVAGKLGGFLGDALYFGQPNDCVVRQTDTALPGVTPQPFNVSHTSIPLVCTGTPMVDDVSVRAVVLGQVSGSGAGSRPAGGAAGSAPALPIAQPLAIDGLLTPGATADEVIQMDPSSQASFMLVWLEGDPPVTFDLTLTDPNGTPVADSDPGVNRVAGVPYGFGGMTADIYTIQSPLQGDWTLHVEGTDLPTEGASYLLLAYTDSSVTMSADLTQGSVVVGDSLVLHASLDNGGVPILGATVSADVRLPDGSQQAYTLHDDGLGNDATANDGNYAGGLAASQCGQYDFTVNASGTVSGEDFTRAAVLIGQAGLVGDDGGIAPCVADDDADGCTDAQELGPNEESGGLRDPLNPWDFFDTNGDKQIDLVGDIFSVALAFGKAPGEPGYSTALDRSATAPGGFLWAMGPPDGTIDLVNDIFGVAFQFGHNCQ